MSAKELKIVLVGNTGVGKTCIVKQATTQTFSEDTVATLGASYVSETKRVNNVDVHLQIWDTAGQERYRAMAPMYYRSAMAAIICYAIDERDSFDGVDAWVEGLEAHGDPNVIRFLVANKCDLPNRQVSKEDGEEKAAKLSAYFYEVSAKNGEGIEDLFKDIPRIYLEKFSKVENSTEKVILKNEKKKKNGCCQKGHK